MGTEYIALLGHQQVAAGNALLPLNALPLLGGVDCTDGCSEPTAVVK